MDVRRYTRWMLPLAALGLTLALPAASHAQDRNDARRPVTQTTIQVQFRTTPRWQAVNGTRVEEIAGPERPAYDMFRYNGSYYAYSNSRWYMSPRAVGQFNVVDDRSVPQAFADVPRDHWRNYPSDWQNGPDAGFDDAPATMQVDYIRTPYWMNLRGTRIWVVRSSARLDYDLFRVGGIYYAYDNDQWYSSRHRSGMFAQADDRRVPRELARIPANQWRNYPNDWLDANGNQRWQGSRGDRFDPRDQRSSDAGDRH
jgi:hypothetical protein